MPAQRSVRYPLLVSLVAVLIVGCNCNKHHPSEASMAATEPTSQPGSNPTTASSAMVFGLGPGFVLVPHATYSAKQEAGQVTITARGENPTPGYETKLVQSLLRIWPPQWLLAHKRPDGIAAQVMTPFEVQASFKSDDPVKTIIVGDASGRHEVQVEQPAQ